MFDDLFSVVIGACGCSLILVVCPIGCFSSYDLVLDALCAHQRIVWPRGDSTSVSKPPVSVPASISASACASVSVYLRGRRGV